MADQATYLTAEGKQKLEEELEELKNVKRPEIAARLRHAIEQGDISENADYSSAKEDQGFMEGRIQELEKLLSNVKLIDEMDREKGVVNIGSVVTLLEEGEDFRLLRREQNLGTAGQILLQEGREVQEHLAFPEARPVHPQERALGPRPVETFLHMERLFDNRHLRRRLGDGPQCHAG